MEGGGDFLIGKMRQGRMQKNLGSEGGTFEGKGIAHCALGKWGKAIEKCERQHNNGDY